MHFNTHCTVLCTLIHTAPSCTLIHAILTPPLLTATKLDKGIITAAEYERLVTVDMHTGGVDTHRDTRRDTRRARGGQRSAQAV
jgi:hypothetical protein